MEVPLATAVIPVVSQAIWLGIVQLLVFNRQPLDPRLVVEVLVVVEEDSADHVEVLVVVVEASLVVQVVALLW